MAVIHASHFIQYRPSSDSNSPTPWQLLHGHEPDISHVKTFGCAVYVVIPEPKRTKLGPQRRLGIYVGFVSPSIIRYLEPQTGQMFTARFADAIFNETVFPKVGGASGGESTIEKSEKEISQLFRRIISIQEPTLVNSKSEKFSIFQASLTRFRTRLLIPSRVKTQKSQNPAANAPIDIRVEDEHTVSSQDVPAQKRRGNQGTKRLLEGNAIPPTIAMPKKPRVTIIAKIAKTGSTRFLHTNVR